MGQVSPEAGGTTGLQLAAQITDSQISLDIDWVNEGLPLHWTFRKSLKRGKIINHFTKGI